jgi:hypothetical protein
LSEKALYDKALDEKARQENLDEKMPGHQFFKTLNVRCLPKKPRTTRHLTRRTDNKQKDSENDCNMFLPLPLSL